MIDQDYPYELWPTYGSAVLIAIVVSIALINAGDSVPIVWKAVLSTVLATVGLTVAYFTINGWRDWNLFRTTAVETPGLVVHRKHDIDRYAVPYGYAVAHCYSLVVQFTNEQKSIELEVQVNGSRYAATRKGSSLVVRYAPSKPKLAIILWTAEPQS